MISKATAIQHGQAMTNYATKNNRADIVKTNHLSEGLPPMGMGRNGAAPVHVQAEVCQETHRTDLHTF